MSFWSLVSENLENSYQILHIFFKSLFNRILILKTVINFKLLHVILIAYKEQWSIVSSQVFMYVYISITI